ncbi:MAG: hypothetical protein JWN70_6581 [Planctomycetaceae bacterium]|nr:hypothetical protein [Planctomycetaceae bacterium]
MNEAKREHAEKIIRPFLLKWVGISQRNLFTFDRLANWNCTWRVEIPHAVRSIPMCYAELPTAQKQ